MGDFAKCLNNECHLRKDCLRYRAYVYGRYAQWYSEFKPKGNSCDGFKKIEKHHKVNSYE